MPSAQSSTTLLGSNDSDQTKICGPEKSSNAGPNLSEPGERAVIGLFHIVWEEAGWELAPTPVILDAFAAKALSAAGLPRAIASFTVLIGTAFFHDLFPWSPRD